MDRDNPSDRKPFEDTRLSAGNEPGNDLMNERSSRFAKNDQPDNKRKPNSQQFALFYMLTVFVGILICIVIFAVVFNSMSRNDEPPADTPSSQSASEGAEQINQVIGVVQANNISGRTLTILNSSSGKQYSVSVSSSTQMKDKYGAPVVLEDFKTGDIVEALFDESNGMAKTLAKSALAWVLPTRKDVQIDTAGQTITIGNDSYTYNDKLIALYADTGAAIDLGSILPMDVVTVAGFAGEAWVVTLNQGHGYVRIRHHEYIENGTYELDTSDYAALHVDPIAILEGLHKIVIRGDNIEPYVTEVNVKAGETEEINLDTAQIKSGILNITVNETVYKLLIDNVEVNSTEPAVLPYGEHVIRAEKDGFVPDEKVVNIRQPSTSVSLELNATVKMGRVRVTTTPREADVYIDRTFVGASPINLPMELGRHTLMVQKEGYETISLTIDVNMDSEPYDKPWDVTLKPIGAVTVPEPTQAPEEEWPFEDETSEPWIVETPKPDVMFPNFDDLDFATPAPPAFNW